MVASQYKDYVLILLFVKYVSNKYAGDPGVVDPAKNSSPSPWWPPACRRCWDRWANAKD